MGVGHAAVALGAAKGAPRVNVGWLVFGSFLADFLLGIFALVGLEQAHVPADYASRHYLIFTFPYSHGLVPLLLWSTVFGLLVSRTRPSERRRVFLVVAAVVLSHFILDGLVHVAGLPVAGEDSPKFGLGLWKHMAIELALETLMAVAGVVLYLRTAGAAASAWSRRGIPLFMALLTALTWTQISTTKPPEPAQLLSSWIAGPLLFGAVVYALDRKRALAQATQATADTSSK